MYAAIYTAAPCVDAPADPGRAHCRFVMLEPRNERPSQGCWKLLRGHAPFVWRRLSRPCLIHVKASCARSVPSSCSYGVIIRVGRDPAPAADQKFLDCIDSWPQRAHSPRRHRLFRPSRGGDMPSLKGTETEQNLKDAFAGESQANHRYVDFAQKADVEGFNDAAAVFRSTAEGETGHAHGHLEYHEED